ncbi:hypothetical protein C478_03195 [Natrinema thermotolerans DSM 11552]|uniref:hypothetical protein n=1 Tax=Natrinema sp. H-ect1 TaxID=3242700 RepID=UPI0002B20727|nr:hypothetical protein C478_03195 [Natrinema thermotolerans DSM 11552]
MESVRTGFGGEVSIEIAALVVAVGAALLLLGFPLAIGRNLGASIAEVVVTGAAAGIAYYLGHRMRS